MINFIHLSLSYIITFSRNKDFKSNYKLNSFSVLGNLEYLRMVNMKVNSLLDFDRLTKLEF